MRYVRFTYVDAKTQTPVTKEPAKNGPAIPGGVSYAFSIEQTFGVAPVFYGIADDDFEPEPWMAEINESDFLDIYRSELKWRADSRREIVLNGGIEVGGVLFKTDDKSQARIGNIVLNLQVDPSIQEIKEFKAASGWVTLTRDEAIAAGNAVFAHVQRCFGWCGAMHSRIDAELIDIQSGAALAGEIQLFA